MIFLNLGLILVSLGIIGFIFALRCDMQYNVLFVPVCFTFFIFGVIITLCYVIDRDINPIAMDVYRCKTTLEVTYRDGIAIDSTVVFKERK